MKVIPIEQYVVGDTTYIVFNRNTEEKAIYQYAYKEALKNDLKVGRLIYSEAQLLITLTQLEHESKIYQNIYP